MNSVRVFCCCFLLVTYGLFRRYFCSLLFTTTGHNCRNDILAQHGQPECLTMVMERRRVGRYFSSVPSFPSRSNGHPSFGHSMRPVRCYFFPYVSYCPAKRSIYPFRCFHVWLLMFVCVFLLQCSTKSLYVHISH